MNPYNYQRGLRELLRRSRGDVMRACQLAPFSMFPEGDMHKLAFDLSIATHAFFKRQVRP